MSTGFGWRCGGRNWPGTCQPLGRVGQIHAVQANLRYPASVEAAMRDSQVAINLVGTLAESGSADV